MQQENNTPKSGSEYIKKNIDSITGMETMQDMKPYKEPTLGELNKQLEEIIQKKSILDEKYYKDQINIDEQYKKDKSEGNINIIKYHKNQVIVNKHYHNAQKAINKELDLVLQKYTTLYSTQQQLAFEKKDTGEFDSLKKGLEEDLTEQSKTKSRSLDDIGLKDEIINNE